MKHFNLILVLFVVSVCSREEVQDDELSQLTNQIFFEIEKRLKDDPETFDALAKSGLFDDYIPTCTREFSNNTIIKADDSIDNGALFLGTPEIISLDDCFNKCCNTDDCDTAVYKNRVGKLVCYLFHCGSPNICEFSDHESFYTMAVMPSSKQLATKHENDLDNLAAAESTTTTSTTSSTTTTVASTTTTETEISDTLSGLYGSCKSTAHCSGANLVCIANFCVCDNGFHAQDGVCRADCSHFQFECKNTGNPNAQPACIAIYDRCDNFQHCADNSDELDCAPDSGNVVDANSNEDDDDTNSLPTPTPEADDKSDADDSNSAVVHEDNSQLRSEVESTPDEEEHSKQTEIEQDSEEQKPSSAEIEEPSAESDISVSGKKSSSPDSESPSHDKDASHDHLADDTQKSTNTTNTHASKVTEVKVVKEVDEFVLIKDLRSRNNRTAVIVLSVGLVCTAILLLFVGCRLRNMRRRLRKGRPMNSNEADYLINGMYL